MSTAPDISTHRVTAGRVIAALWIVAMVYVLALSSFAPLRPGGRAITPNTIEQLIFLVLWGVATPAIIWSAERLPIDRGRWLRRIVVHLGIAVAFIVGLNLVAPTLAWIVLGHAVPFGSVLRRGLTELVGVGHLALVMYAFILGAGHYLRTLDIRRREQLRSERLRADLASAQLRALTLRLQPHFLFNALNTVGALIVTERNREAFDVVGRLGELLRALLTIDRRDEVTVREELELAESYVGIEQARLGDRLRVTWDVAPEVGSAQLPPMLLQPLVENAIRHGVARSATAGHLTIAVRRNEARLALEISDDGPGPAPSLSDERSSGTGVGLENTRRRLAHLYGDECLLQLVRDNGWTRVRVELPYHVLANVPQPNAEGAAA